MTPPRTTGAALVVKHADWEGPHRIATALSAAGVPIITRMPLRGEPLPSPGGIAGVVIMGGPMNVDDTATHPGLEVERGWLEGVLSVGLPVLGVCLGSQLLARALGATVRPGDGPEIGWAPVQVGDAADPVVGPLAPAADVLHWHGDVYDTPPGAEWLAGSERTPCQAFRHEEAWGLLFHAEADAGLLERWLAEPGMVTEARDALGTDAEAILRAGAGAHGETLVARGAPGLAAFAARVAARHAEFGA